MEFVLEPWHWFVLGVLLMLSELVLPAFACFMVWRWGSHGRDFIPWMFPMTGTTTQLVMWIILLVLCTLWRGLSLSNPYLPIKPKQACHAEPLLDKLAWLFRPT